PYGWQDREVVLMLDTFEELQSKRTDGDRSNSSGVYAADQIANWSRALVRSGGLSKLRVVVSGRAPIDRRSKLAAMVVDRIELDDLEPPDAIRLLKSHDMAHDLATQLQEVVGGNPLLLRIAARLMRRLSRRKAAEILDELSD